MIRVLDIGIGNINSVCNMLEFLNLDYEKVTYIELDTKKLILVGNGNFLSVIEKLKDTGNFEALKKLVANNTTHILGICVGAQIFGNYSEEGNCQGLGIVNFDILKLKSTKNLKVPNVGWHSLVTKESPAFEGLMEVRFYFSHSYEMTNFVDSSVNSYIVIGNQKIVSSFTYNKVWGVQFHPEKSHKFGLSLLHKFSNYEV